MPRGVKKQVNYEDEIKKIDAQIAKHKKAITALKNHKKDLQGKREKYDLSRLRNVLQTSGMSIEELLKLAKHQNGTP